MFHFWSILLFRHCENNSMFVESCNRKFLHHSDEFVLFLALPKIKVFPMSDKAVGRLSVNKSKRNSCQMIIDYLSIDFNCSTITCKWVDEKTKSYSNKAISMENLKLKILYSFNYYLQAFQDIWEVKIVIHSINTIHS